MGELSVSISYKQKGTINNLYFELGKDRQEIPKNSELSNRLKKVVRLAKSNQGEFSFLDAQYLLKLTIQLPLMKVSF